jgi:DNA-binding PadR family transcriptional regulator
LQKRDVFSLITNKTRNIILRRIAKVEKAGYSDLLNSVEDHLHPLTSSGNFNYHLNFLLKNSLIVKDGLVYRLTDKGKEITRFVVEIDHQWNKIEKIVRGENLSIFNLAEQFEEETGIKMEKEVIDFKGSEMIMDSRKIIGILGNIDDNSFFAGYNEIDIEQFTMKKITIDQESGIQKTVFVLMHPKIDYYISPKYFGIIQEFSEKNFNVPRLFAILNKPAPFLVRAENVSRKSYFIIAPSYVENQYDKEPKRKNRLVDNDLPSFYHNLFQANKTLGIVNLEGAQAIVIGMIGKLL